MTACHEQTPTVIDPCGLAICWSASYPAGAEFWNADRTEGYRLVRHAVRNRIVKAADLVALGDAVPPRENGYMPTWMQGCASYGCVAMTDLPLKSR